MHTVKPLDEDLVLSYAKKTGAVVTAENHQIAGGLGAAVANLLSTHYPTPMEMVGIHDEFGQVGTQAWLQTYYKLTAEEIVRKVLSIRSKS
jgi:transketolase